MVLEFRVYAPLSPTAIISIAFKLFNSEILHQTYGRMKTRMSNEIDIDVEYINDNKTFGHNGLYVFSWSCVDE